MNSNLLKTDRDQGNDGLSATTNLHKFIPADQFGYSLAYFTGDYTAAGSDFGGYVPFEANYTANAAMVAGNLCNGNIKHMVTAIAPLMSTTSVTPNKPQAMVYSYDQLNRLSSAKSVNDFNTTTNAWNNTAPSNAFGEQLTYDRNGNIQTLKRYGGTVSDLLMDDFTYTYTSGRNQLLSLKENKLTDLYANDIEGRAAAWGYTYDKIGQLLTDEYAQIAEIKWTANNKVSEVKRAATSNQEDVRFVYDAMGRRIQKTVIGKVESGSNFVLAASSTWKHTFYTYDASGNQLGAYKLIGTQLSLEDQTIYGAARIGTVNRNVAITNNTFVPSYQYMPGQKTYELANQLGNVLVTVSDARIAINNAGVVARYEAKFVTYSDYYPFGMQMPGRKGGSGYRYGFQGQEKDDEIKGEGNSLNYEYRMHDPRVGRFFAIDPLAPKYPHNSTCAFSENRVIDAFELEGLEAVCFNGYTWHNYDGKSTAFIGKALGWVESAHQGNVSAQRVQGWNENWYVTVDNERNYWGKSTGTTLNFYNNRQDWVNNKPFKTVTERDVSQWLYSTGGEKAEGGGAEAGNQPLAYSGTKGFKEKGGATYDCDCSYNSYGWYGKRSDGSGFC